MQPTTSVQTTLAYAAPSQQPTTDSTQHISSRRPSLAARWQASLRETAAASEARARQLEKARLASLQGEVAHIELRPGEVKGHDGAHLWAHPEHSHQSVAGDDGVRRGTVSEAVHNWSDSAGATRASTAEHTGGTTPARPHVSYPTIQPVMQPQTSSDSLAPAPGSSLPGMALVSSPKRSGLTRPLQAADVLLSPAVQHSHPIFQRVSLHQEAVAAAAASPSRAATAARSAASPIPAGPVHSVWPAAHAEHSPRVTMPQDSPPVLAASAAGTSGFGKRGPPTFPEGVLAVPQVFASGDINKHGPDPITNAAHASNVPSPTAFAGAVASSDTASDSASDSDDGGAVPDVYPPQVSGRRARGLTAEQEALLLRTLSPRNQSDSGASNTQAKTHRAAFSFDSSPPMAAGSGSLSPRARAASDGSSPLRTCRSDHVAVPPTPSSPAPVLPGTQSTPSPRTARQHTHRQQYNLPQHKPALHSVPTASPLVAPKSDHTSHPGRSALPSAAGRGAATAGAGRANSASRPVPKPAAHLPLSRGTGSTPLTPGLHIQHEAVEVSSSDDDEGGSHGLYSGGVSDAGAGGGIMTRQQLDLYRRTMSPPVESSTRERISEVAAAGAASPTSGQAAAASSSKRAQDSAISSASERAQAKAKRINALLYGVASPPHADDGTERGARTQRAIAHAAAQALVDAPGTGRGAHVSASPVVGGGLVAEEAAAAASGARSGPLASDDDYFHSLDGFGEEDLRALGVGDVSLPQGGAPGVGQPGAPAGDVGAAGDLFADMPVIEGADGDADMDLDALLDAQWMAEQQGYMQDASSVATRQTGSHS